MELRRMQVTGPIFGEVLGERDIYVHEASQCEGRNCPIHNPSDSVMKDWPLLWRADTRVMERTCPHGIGHPDIDHLAYVIGLDKDNQWHGVHGCDGCCREVLNGSTQRKEMG